MNAIAILEATDNADATATEFDVVNAEDIHNADTDSADADETNGYDVVDGCHVEHGLALRKVSHNGSVIGQVADFGGEWHAFPVSGLGSTHSDLESAVAHLRGAATRAAKAPTTGKGKDPKERALSLVTMHTRRYHRFMREFNMAVGQRDRFSATVERAEEACGKARERAASTKSGFAAQDALDIADRKHLRADRILEVYGEDVDSAERQMKTVAAQLDQAVREARELGATQADTDTARSKGKPKARPAA
ncbi:hypothetical protein OG563_26580 [Nocardia vinacea]|uniref:Uncharacterized protein n=1 Tax=Nocardia vinacea TaxID=96468 RepID=A0ABZ1YHX5_9NOCA|nr:hypothetical protein [Nocardia vinacea]